MRLAAFMTEFQGDYYPTFIAERMTCRHRCGTTIPVNAYFMSEGHSDQ